MSTFIINVPYKIMKQVDVGAYFGRLLALIMAVLLCIGVLKRHTRINMPKQRLGKPL